MVMLIDILAKGKMNPGGMVTKKVALEDVVEGAFKTLIANKENHVKIMVDLSKMTAQL
jgi:threonine dehydrogenase-like Zn-dependent dehydrogenase